MSEDSTGIYIAHLVEHMVQACLLGAEFAAWMAFQLVEAKSVEIPAQVALSLVQG